jgi:hypothetical protein
MWYLVVNDNSERFFIKKKDDNIVYFTKENSNILQEKELRELRDNNFKVVGEAFTYEIKKLDKLLII